MTCIDINLNSRSSILERINAGKITLLWPVLIVFARLILAFIAQSLTALILLLNGNPESWTSAAPWWVVNGTLIDIGCLILIAHLVKKEGIKCKDLVNLEKNKFGKVVLQCVLFIVVFLILFMAGGMIFGRLLYSDTAPSPYGPLPLWAAIYSVLVWPVIWAITEQLTYMGYALPRIQAITNKNWIAVCIIAFGWSIQHIALPFVLDWQWTLYRFLSVIPLSVVLAVIFLRTRRLLPYIIAHWVIDLFGTLVFVLLPVLQK